MPKMTDLRFSAQSLQDYVDCPYRFYLRYIQRLEYPAEQSSPYLEFERFRQRGELFHRCVDQYFHQVEPKAIQASITDIDVRNWWDRFLQFISQCTYQKAYSEILFQTHLEGHPLVAKVDLLMISEDKKVLIYDWKTTARDKRPSRRYYTDRMQTIVYPFLLSRTSITGEEVDPANIQLTYWFPQFAEQPETFTYSAQHQQQDEATLHSLIQEIEAKDPVDFAKTEEKRLCRFCVYRSLCDRGVKAGAIDEVDIELELDSMNLDFDEIEEIEY